MRVLRRFAFAPVMGAVALLALSGTAGASSSQSLCIGHHPQPFVWYTHSCTGHDEPELDPLSNQAGSAQNLTWTGNSESAAFNAMLTDSATGGPLIMHAGDTVTDHQYITAARDGMHITVTDLSTGHSGTIVLDPKVDGPLMPYYSVQQLGNEDNWGLVYDAPNSFVWEIGHTGNYTSPAGQLCDPGETGKNPCYSYNVPTWQQFSPVQIKGVTFGDGSRAGSWAVVSDLGAEAEVNQYCGAANYGTPFCWYPWFAYNKTDSAFTYGDDYPGTSNDFGQAAQFAQQQNCSSPVGSNPQYCATVIK